MYTPNVSSSSEVSPSQDALAPSHRACVNAAIAYWFLGWIFLLARQNPVFAHPFVRAHAWQATRLHLGFFAGFIAYRMLLARYALIGIPVLGISLDRLLVFIAFGLFTLVLVHHAWRAAHGVAASALSWRFFAVRGSATTLSAGASEHERVLDILSFIPFIGTVVAARHPSELTALGTRFADSAAILLILAWVSSPEGSSLSVGLALVWAFAFAFVALTLMVSGTLKLGAWSSLVPSLPQLWNLIRVGALYIYDAFAVVFGSKRTLDFFARSRALAYAEQLEDQAYTTSRTMGSASFSRAWAFVPVANLIFLPAVFSPLASDCRVARQGVVLTVLFLGLGFWFGAFHPMLLALAVLAIHGIAVAPALATVRVPILYELSLIFSLLSSHAGRATRGIQGASEKQSVSFRVDDSR